MVLVAGIGDCLQVLGESPNAADILPRASAFTFQAKWILHPGLGAGFPSHRMSCHQLSPKSYS
jgi:hypothetical protein